MQFKGIALIAMSRDSHTAVVSLLLSRIQQDLILRPVSGKTEKTTTCRGIGQRSELPYGFMTHKLNGGIPNHGYTHWWKMFNPRQLLVHTQLLTRNYHRQ